MASFGMMLNNPAFGRFRDMQTGGNMAAPAAPTAPMAPQAPTGPPQRPGMGWGNMVGVAEKLRGMIGGGLTADQMMTGGNVDAAGPAAPAGRVNRAAMRGRRRGGGQRRLDRSGGAGEMMQTGGNMAQNLGTAIRAMPQPGPGNLAMAMRRPGMATGGFTGGPGGFIGRRF